MSCYVEMFHKIPHNNQHNTNPSSVKGLVQNYHLHFDPNLGLVKCAIRYIPRACNACTDQLGFLWNPNFVMIKNQDISFQNVLSNQMYWVS